MMIRAKDANNYPLIVVLFGVVFSGLGALVLFLVKELSIPFIIGVLFVACGILFFVVGVVRLILLIRYKCLYKNPKSFETTAKFVKSKSTSYLKVYGGDTNFFEKVYYTYIDEKGIDRKGKSFFSYDSDQIEYLMDKKEFKIKCIGKRSVITDPMI